MRSSYVRDDGARMIMRGHVTPPGPGRKDWKVVPRGWQAFLATPGQQHYRHAGTYPDRPTALNCHGAWGHVNNPEP